MVLLLVSTRKKSLFCMAAFLVIIATSLLSMSIDPKWSVVIEGDAQQEQEQEQAPSGKVFVMYAASLIKTFEETLGPAFQNETGYLYDGEPRGSVQIANMIIDGLRTPDIFVSADTVPIKKLMNNTSPFAEWLIKFGSAEMVIAYSPMSRFVGDLEKARTGEILWYQVLSKQDFKFGRTDPELDPKGYYMIISAELANLHYNDSGIKQRIMGDDRNKKQIFPEEILKTILEQGQLDAVAAYKHEAVARGLPYITLPPQINLADPTFIDFYKKGSYTLRNGGQTIYGEPIYFSFTIPTTVKNMDGAISFGDFMLSTSGKNILKDQGLNPIKPVVECNKAKVPSVLRSIVGEDNSIVLLSQGSDIDLTR
jgi:molybdate/tungstate transport system substrate-binding protein